MSSMLDGLIIALLILCAFYLGMLSMVAIYERGRLRAWARAKKMRIR